MERDDRRRGGISRRDFHRLGAGLLIGAAVPGMARRASADDHTELVTAYPANEPILAAVQYVNETAIPERACSGCALYQPAADGRGKCGLFQKGLVSEQGWCTSWIAKP